MEAGVLCTILEYLECVLLRKIEFGFLDFERGWLLVTSNFVRLMLFQRSVCIVNIENDW